MQAQVQAELLEQDEILAEIVRRLADNYHPRSIYLFGSKARGDHGPDSDYDILVVVPDETPRERRASAKGYDCLWGMATAVDAMVCTDSYFHSRGRVRTSLPARVLREGKLLYAV